MAIRVINDKVKKYLCFAAIGCTGLASFLFSIPAIAASSDDVCYSYNQQVGSSFVQTVQSGKWEEPATWGGSIPAGGDRVQINHEVTVSNARSAEIQVTDKLQIAGRLDVQGSILVCSGGLLSGTEGTIAFHIENDRLFAGNTRPGPVPGLSDFHPADIGLWVMPGGSVRLEGEKVTSWLNADGLTDRFRRWRKGVSRSRAFDDGNANLESEPVGWHEGDQLLLVTELGEYVLAELTGIQGKEINYKLEPGDSLEGYVLRAETEFENNTVHPKVANLSRRLQIISAGVNADSTNHRAHMAFLENSNVELHNVEIRNLGPRAKLGRYPVHWHHTSSTTGVLSGSSIWQSVDEGGNRFVTLHMASGVKVTDNVAFRSQGHGFFMEELHESNNVVSGNLSVDVRHGEELPNVEEAISNKTHHYWVRAGNNIHGNVAAGNDWEVKGNGNREPQIEGLVVLPAFRNTQTTVLSDFECLGCGGVGMWVAAPDVIFERPVSTNAIVSGFKGYKVWDVDSSGTILEDPLFLFNGDNGAFSKSSDYADFVPWGSQVFLNYGDVSISGGTLVGEVAVHAHYHARFDIDNAHIIANKLADPTYWEVGGAIKNSRIDVDYLFGRGYGKTRRASPGLIRVFDSCFRKNCGNEKAWESLSFSSQYYSQFFGSSSIRNKSNSIGGNWLEISDTDLLTGYISLPPDVPARFWSVVPADYPVDRSTPTLITEDKSSWSEDFPRHSGFLDGFPPGRYRVSLYRTANADSLVWSNLVDVVAGEVMELGQISLP